VYAYCDANYAGDEDEKRSTSFFVSYMNGGPIGWSCKLQEMTSVGTAMAEYKALYKASTEIVEQRNLLEELGYLKKNSPSSLSDSKPTVIFEDCQPAIDYSHNNINKSTMKGIEIKYHSTRHFIKKGYVHIQKIDTIDQVADIGTKPLSVSTFTRHRDKLLVPKLI